MNHIKTKEGLETGVSSRPADHNKKALLVYPEFPTHTYWNFKLMREKIFGKNKYGKAKANFPPLGLLCIAVPIAEVYGRENVRLIDTNTQPLTDKDLL